MSPSHYSTFISYSSSDRTKAQWLHRSIERFPIPKTLRGQRKSLAPVFIDRAELASSPDLTDAVRSALDRSDNLIVVCSPRSAASRWVNEEIRIFKIAGKAQRIFCLIVDGEPGQDAKPERSCYPPTLRFELASDGELTNRPAATPLGADIRPNRDPPRDALLKLIAGLLSVPFDQLKQRALRRRRQILVMTTALGVAILSAIGVAMYQRQVAQQQAETAKIAARVSDEAARREVERRRKIVGAMNEQVQKANPDRQFEVNRISKSDLETLITVARASPDPTLSATFAETYAGLGLFSEGKKWSTEAEQQFRSEIGAPVGDKLMVTTVLGEILLARGEFAEATQWFRQAVQLASGPDLRNTSAQTRAMAGLANALVETDQFEEADKVLQEAQAIDTSQDGAVSVNVARDIGLRATNFYYHGDLERAEALFRESIEMRRQTLPAGHVKIAEDMNALGSIYFMRQDHARAEVQYEQALIIYRRFYGENHPDTAVLKHNLGRTKLERSQFREAMALTQDGLGASEKELTEDHVGLTFSYDSLGLAQMGLGQYRDAEKSFLRALQVANKHKHRMRGPIQTNLADLQCRMNEFSRGIATIASARPLLAEDYVESDRRWRLALADSVEGACLVGSGEPNKGRSMARDGYRTLLKELGPLRLFTRDAARRAKL